MVLLEEVERTNDPSFHRRVPFSERVVCQSDSRVNETKSPARGAFWYDRNELCGVSLFGLVGFLLLFFDSFIRNVAIL